MPIPLFTIDAFIESSDIYRESIGGHEYNIVRNGDQLYKLVDLRELDRPGAGLAYIEVEGVGTFTMTANYVRRISERWMNEGVLVEEDRNFFVIFRTNIAAPLPTPKKYSGNQNVLFTIEEVSDLTTDQFLKLIETYATEAIEYGRVTPFGKLAVSAMIV